ncbi:MAG: EscU/YscU/HrcU family type III secretion system export apparatus switch protein [Burkholderiales bacterium]|nr:EscU/YscU/HrcU family type III secretion system export apparatus switch protein [Burkholderiales bacterium]
MSEDTVPTRVVGLRYEPGEGLPEVILKGSGPLASELLAQRGRDAPPVVRDEALLEALYRLPVDSTIGPALFQAVAVLLSHVFAVDGRRQAEEQWTQRGRQ